MSLRNLRPGGLLESTNPPKSPCCLIGTQFIRRSLLGGVWETPGVLSQVSRNTLMLVSWTSIASRDARCVEMSCGGGSPGGAKFEATHLTLSRMIRQFSSVTEGCRKDHVSSH